VVKAKSPGYRRLPATLQLSDSRKNDLLLDCDVPEQAFSELCVEIHIDYAGFRHRPLEQTVEPVVII